MPTWTAALMRWAGALLVGLVVVYLLTVTGLYFFGWFDDAEPASRRMQAVDLLSEIERVRLKDELRLDQRRARPAPPPPPPVRVPRSISGFVQLEVEVGRAGEVLDARVVGAVPEGYYEEQALRHVRSRRYAPAPLGSYRITEVIPFNVTHEHQDKAPD